jgi:hypothetical protein
MKMIRPTPIIDGKCSFCLSNIAKESQTPSGDWTRISCPCCGDYRLSGTAHDALGHWDLSEHKWTAMAFNVRRMTDRATPPMVTLDLVRQLRETPSSRLRTRRLTNSFCGSVRTPRDQATP